MGRTTFRPDGSITTCLHRERGDTCGQRAVVLAAYGDIVTVIGVNQEEAEELIHGDRSLKEGLRELEILVGRIP